MIKDYYNKTDPVFSFEVFPPKKDDEFMRIFPILNELAVLKPDFISVTYGAAGSSSKKTAAIASYIQNICGIESLAHLTCVNFDEETLKYAIEEFNRTGIRNILALKGDKPKDMSLTDFLNRTFKHASDMIHFIKTNEADKLFSIAAACYPEKHFEAKTMEEDLFFLKEKVNMGVDFLITQLFFDNDTFYQFMDKIRKNHISIPVSAGIMPITASTQLGTTVHLSGASVPAELSAIIAKYGERPEEMKKAGIDYAIRQILDLLKHGVDGIHLYTMNKPEVASAILNGIR